MKDEGSEFTFQMKAYSTSSDDDTNPEGKNRTSKHKQKRNFLDPIEELEETLYETKKIQLE